MPYTAEKPRLTPPVSELREKIPGWGVDLDRKDRPAVPKENFDPGATGAHWDFPERQIERWPRERSNEHKFLTPVFGTACPPKGLSGRIRRYAYTFSEGRLTHWLLLIVADRVDVAESRMTALASGHPDRKIRETGILSEVSREGIQTRVRERRADVKHHPIDALMFAAPYVAIAAAVYALSRALVRTASEPAA